MSSDLNPPLVSSSTVGNYDSRLETNTDEQVVLRIATKLLTPLVTVHSRMNSRSITPVD